MFVKITQVIISKNTDGEKALVTIGGKKRYHRGEKALP